MGPESVKEEILNCTTDSWLGSLSLYKSSGLPLKPEKSLETKSGYMLCKLGKYHLEHRPTADPE